MRMYHRLCRLPPAARGCVVAIGNFDGVHRGHQRVLAIARAAAATIGAGVAALTFTPHPRRLFNPDLPPFSLASMRVKLDRLAERGMDFTFVQRFDPDFAGLSADEFATGLLVDRLAVRHVVVGEDYRFGHRRSGDVDRLRAFGARHGFGVTAVPALRDDDGLVCSSTRVRAALANGRPDHASDLLGGPWEIGGRMVMLSEDVAAIPLGSHQRPRPGTYAVAAAIDAGRRTDWNGAHETTARLFHPWNDAPDDAFVLAPPTPRPTSTGVRLRLLGRLSA